MLLKPVWFLSRSSVKKTCHLTQLAYSPTCFRATTHYLSCMIYWNKISKVPIRPMRVPVFNPMNNLQPPLGQLCWLTMMKLLHFHQIMWMKWILENRNVSFIYYFINKTLFLVVYTLKVVGITLLVCLGISALANVLSCLIRGRLCCVCQSP